MVGREILIGEPRSWEPVELFPAAAGGVLLGAVKPVAGQLFLTEQRPRAAASPGCGVESTSAAEQYAVP